MNLKKSLVIIFLIILFYPLLIKYVFVQHNQFEQIPLILRYLNPNYLSDDWSVNINSLFSPRILFVRYIGSLSKFLSLPVTYYLNYLFMVFLISISSFFMSKRLFRSNFIAILTTIFVIFGQSYTLGGNDLIGRDFDPTRLAFGSVITGFVLLLNTHYFVSAIFFSFASYLHPLIGFESPIVIYFVSLLVNITAKRNKFIISISKSIVLYFILSSYSFYTYLQSFLTHNYNDILKVHLFTILAQIRAPFHYLPYTWPTAIYLKFLIFFSLFLVILTYYRKLFSKHDKKIIICAIITIGILCTLGFIFSEIIPVYEILTLQFFRLTVLVYWICAIIIYGGCFYFANTSRIQRLNLNSIVPVLPFIIARSDTLLNPGYTNKLYLVLSLILGIILFRIKTVKGAYLFIITAILTFSLLFRHYLFNFNKSYPFETPETSLSLWIKSSTPKDSVFLVPPDFYAFRLTGERAIVVDWLVMPFEPKGMKQWIERIVDVSGLNNIEYSDINEQKVINGYKKLDKHRLNFLFQKYEFDYLIVEIENKLDLPEVHRTNRYIVYQVATQ